MPHLRLLVKAETAVLRASDVQREGQRPVAGLTPAGRGGDRERQQRLFVPLDFGEHLLGGFHEATTEFLGYWLRVT